MTQAISFDAHNIPTFPCEENRLGQLLFTCTQCGIVNTHGSGNGHRSSHCACWPTGYFIVKAAWEGQGEVA